MSKTYAKRRRLFAAIGYLAFSPTGWIVLGLASVLLFAGADALGWRNYTSAFSGTLPAEGKAGTRLALLGLAYAGLYFTAVLIAPIFVIAGLLHLGTRRV